MYSPTKAFLYNIYGKTELNSVMLSWPPLVATQVEFKQKQTLNTHELYQLEGNAYLLESTFTRLSIENLISERIRAWYWDHLCIMFMKLRTNSALILQVYTWSAPALLNQASICV